MVMQQQPNGILVHNSSFHLNMQSMNNTGPVNAMNTSMYSQAGGESRKFVKELRPPVELRNGAIYSGEWVGSKKEGNGVQRWPDGAIYEGEWKNGKANGEGMFTHANGDIFKGTWVDDKASGYGEFSRIAGSKYWQYWDFRSYCFNDFQFSGYWKEDLQNGHGVEEWPDGSRYQGYYKDGKKHGQGAYTWNDGSSYDGFWRENYLDGYGAYKWPDGRRYDGYWQGNNMHGKGKYSWKDGRYYDGEYFEDQKNGYGVYRWADGKRYEGEWLNGMQHGRGTFIYPTGEVRQGIFENGKRTRWLDGLDALQESFATPNQLGNGAPISNNMNQSNLQNSQIVNTQGSANFASVNSTSRTPANPNSGQLYISSSLAKPS